MQVRVAARPRWFTSVSARGALALAAVGLFAMAVVAAAPRSPYQPILMPHDRPVGPLRDLAGLLGLDNLTGTPQLAVAVLVAAFAVGSFLLLLREAFRGNVSVRAVAGLTVFGHALVLFLPLLFSRDVYSYAFYGRIAGIYGGNPYIQTPLDHSGDMLWRYVGPKWIDTPSVYGPAWSTVSTWLARVLPHPSDHVDAYRLLALFGSLATCAAIVWVVRDRWPERTPFALAAFGANPVVVFHAVGSGHNDVFVALALITAVGLLLRGRSRAAVAALTFGALVKATIGIALILLLIWVIARQSPEARRRVFAAHAAAAAAVAAVFAVPFLQWTDPSLGILELTRHTGWLAPQAVLRRAIDGVTFGTMGWVARVAFAAVLLVAFTRLGRDVWRRGSALSVDGVVAAFGWAIVLLTLLGPLLMPWYVLWSLPFVWIVPRAARTAIVATAALMVVSLWSTEAMRFPAAFEVNLFVGQWIVSPILLYLAWTVLRDLRLRVDIGFPLEDDASPSAILAVPNQPDGQQRVPAAAGDR
jgi:alpha-1,6-mannosyltransferase